MKVQLTQRDIETAMTAYVEGMGLTGTIDSMSFTRTRQGKGGESEFLVDIEIFRDGEHKPLKAAKPEVEAEPEAAPAPKAKKAKAPKAEPKAEPKQEDPQEQFASEEEEAPFIPSAEDEAAKAAQTEAEEAAQDAEEEQAEEPAPIATTGGKSLFTS